ncbi:MAG: hypothetical protein HY872_04500 [Chloroflexi bacterium]|nr:hypothetical protein [Chloroflexota bacterium]
MVRGGSFNNNHRNARCACRNDNHPNNRNDNIGFRVVVSHNSQRPPEMQFGFWAELPRRKYEIARRTPCPRRPPPGRIQN